MKAAAFAALLAIPGVASAQSVTCYRLGVYFQCNQRPVVQAQAPMAPVDFVSGLGQLPDPARAACLGRVQGLINAGRVDDARLQLSVCAGL